MDFRHARGITLSSRVWGAGYTAIGFRGGGG